VITLGRSGKISNLRAPDHMLRQMGVSFFETNRGGDITYHGPGQLVGYPILNLGEIRRDVAWYVRSLEEVMIRATAEFGIVSRRVPGRTGVWVDVPAASGPEEELHKEEEKLAAIGVHLSRWVTTHGFAYNVSTNLRYFELIVPCGITGKRATSLEKLLGRDVEIAEASPRITKHFGEIFGLAPRTCAGDQLDSMLPAPGPQFVGASK
jgi:lipoyl(octanoyl) transferase